MSRITGGNGLDVSRRAIAAHIVGQKISRFPDIARQIRGYLLEQLGQRGLITPEQLEEEALQKLNDLAESLSSHFDVFDVDDIKEMGKNALIDSYAARYLSAEDIEEFINLARKKKRARALKLVLGRTNPPGNEVWARLQEFCELPLGDKRVAPSELLGIRAALIDHFISGHLSFLGVAKHHMTIRGICELAPQIIGTPEGSGRIGGKAAGMLLAMSILHPTLEETDPKFKEMVTSPKSYFIRSDVMDAFKEHNRDLLEGLLEQKYKEVDQIADEYPDICDACQLADFPPEIEEALHRMLEEIGERPIIVRSSSYLEDNSGFAFSGKYTSVFLPNQGELQRRMAGLYLAMKEVYASTYSPEVMMYRRERGLLDYNERMCLLVQEVVGKKRGDYFFPAAAGVAVSRNNYIWSPRIKRKQGLLRMVMGLGTRAVDRVGRDYPRMVPLSDPLLRPETTTPLIFKYSQKYVDVLNLKEVSQETLPIKEALPLMKQPYLGLLSSIDKGGVLIRPMTGRDLDAGRPCITFDGLLKDQTFAPLMDRILTHLEESIGAPVEVEFAYEGGQIYILQCRVLSQYSDKGAVQIPADIPEKNILFTSRHSYSSAVINDIESILYVDAKAYAQLASNEDRSKVARLVGYINRGLKDNSYVLMGPGRWGSNNMELGVKVAYADINHAAVLIEMAWAREDGAVPDVSYGTHFFHDLVEGNIVPMAVHPDDPQTVFNRDFFAQSPPIPEKWREEFKGLEHCVKLFHLPTLTQGHWLKVYVDGDIPQAVAFLG